MIRPLALLIWILVVFDATAFSPVAGPVLTRLRVHSARAQDGLPMDLDERLLELGKKVRLEVLDIDDGDRLFSLESRDSNYGIEILHPTVSIAGGLGMVLREVAGNDDGRGLVLVREVSGNACKATPSPIQVGDIVSGVRTSDFVHREETKGANFEKTVEAINAIKEKSTDGKVVLEIMRLVPRAKVQVEVLDSAGKVIETIDALAGENLRRMLLRRNIKLYDEKTTRFDMPYATGDCAGEGLCGTCLVRVLEGMDVLSPAQYIEKEITQGRPPSWRAACRTVVGHDNKPGKLRIMIHPQSNDEHELKSGVKLLKP